MSAFKALKWINFATLFSLDLFTKVFTKLISPEMRGLALSQRVGWCCEWQRVHRLTYTGATGRSLLQCTHDTQLCEQVTLIANDTGCDKGGAGTA